MKRAVKGWAHNWWKAAKTAWVTHVLAFISVLVFTVTKGFGLTEQAIELLGVQPGNYHTLLTHLIMHSTWYHLVTNLIALEIPGPFVEKWLEDSTGEKPAGKLIYAGIMLGTTMIGAHLTTEMALEHWNEGNHPVGMSIVTNALMAIGIYLLVRNATPTSWTKIVELARNARREALSWAAVVITIILTIAILSVEPDVPGSPSKVGHISGAVAGLAIAAFNAIFRTFRNEEQGPPYDDDQEKQQGSQDPRGETA